MKFLKSIALTATFAAAAFLAPSADATPTVKLAMAGSSAVFNSAADAAELASSGTLCGTNNWTKSNGGTMHDNRSGLGGNPAIQDEVANVWVTWDGAADGSTASVICLYVAVDSGIGVRGYMANPRADLFLVAGLSGSAGDGLVSTLHADVALPAVIFTTINGSATAPFAGTVMNMAFSDVRAEDAQYEAARALSQSCGGVGCPSGFGYGNWPGVYDGWDAGNTGATLVGSKLQSSYNSSENTVPVWYELSPLTNDAFSNQPITAWQSYPVGIIPVLVIVSNEDNSVTGFGAGLSPAETASSGPWTAGPYAASNLNRFTLAYVFDGSLTRTTDVLSNGGAVGKANCSSATFPGGTGSNNCALTELQREVTSGTYTTFEFNIPYSHNVQISQEDGINPVLLSNGNPLNIVSGSGGVRHRVQGTGEMVTAVCGNYTKASGPPPIPNCKGRVPQSGLAAVTHNRIGYAFWSYGNLSPLAGVHGTGTGASYTTAPPYGHYLTVDGIDPLFNLPTDNPDGALNPPICATTPCPAIPFTHEIDGGYSIWTTVQALVPNSVSLGDGSVQDTLLAALPASDAKYSDFLPAGTATVFRSHRDQNIVGYGARNGNGCTHAVDYNNARGASAGGAIFTIQNDLDYLFDNNSGATHDCLNLGDGADLGLTNIRQ